MFTEYIVAMLSFAITAILGSFFIPILVRWKFGQTVRSDGPKRHLEKMGTPTMGGVIFLIAIAITTFFMADKSSIIIVSIISMIGFGLIGFVDDFIKVAKNRSLGLRANQKLFFQLILSLGIALYSYNLFNGKGSILLPFFSTKVNLGVFYIPFTIFVILGTVNSVNLTDGLDGLVAGIVAIISFFYTIVLKTLGNGELFLFSAAMTGACIGFLLYNKHPAKVFMGDTGSLGLGGAIAALAVLSRTHLYLILFGMIFIIETLSVILQVISFKFTGKRIFKMSPIHHHFELIGWKEEKVVYIFWLFTLITGFLGLLIFLLDINM